MDSNKETTIKVRQDAEKALLIEQLRKTPIISVACDKTGVGRTSYYRWRDEDKEFATLADKSLAEGVLLMNDMAESQLLSAIKDGNMTAIIYWLKHRHSAYSTKIEIEGNINTNYELSDSQKELLNKAINLIFKEDYES